MAALVAAKVTKQKITIFLRLFMVCPSYQVQTLSLEGYGSRRRQALVCEPAPFGKNTNHSRWVWPIQTADAPLTAQIFLIHGSALVLHVGRA
ncbi:hypothetical protein QEV83_17870 [Methylocapsa sp. D3K7]|uniref:hypothetical protein n=1 Tax=Methylocapsa sp. D3K7 TaxID=3041435 RepID=UPI00244ED6A8|nr:hypothetical protein [Methylocapsa sp. D3K7]WGJ14470.1 hypothetical protein QEV83_17870 [Methylocapsa sp. D3K7]